MHIYLWLCYYEDSLSIEYKGFNFANHFFLYFFVSQDTREDLYDNCISNSGHYGPVQYISGLLKLPHTSHLQVL